MNRIDTHQHLIYPDQLSYDWLAEVPALQADEFRLEHYHEAAKDCGITSSVFMEVDVAAEHQPREARLINKLAAEPNSGILGIVASCRPEVTEFASYLDLIETPLLKGLRRVLHVAPDDVSEGELFRSNVRLLGERNLSFDLCLRADQLTLGTSLIQACPDTQFILDHCGNPDLTGSDLTQWKNDLSDLAQHDNVVCKISGIPVNCPEGGPTAEAIRPAVETVIELFGWDRVLFGGDWPVCTLNGTLKQWVDSLDEVLRHEDENKLNKLFSENAQRIYRL